MSRKYGGPFEMDGPIQYGDQKQDVYWMNAKRRLAGPFWRELLWATVGLAFAGVALLAIWMVLR